MSDQILFAYATAPDLTIAQNLTRSLVEEELIACANLIPGMHSIYRWEGKIETAAEVAMILKTRQSLWPQLCERFQSLHPYQTPCLIQLQTGDLLPGYRDWLLSSCKNP